MLVLVSSNDLGSALLYFGIFLAMLYVATARLSFVLVGIVLFVAGGFGAYEKIAHVHERVHDLAAPVDDEQGVLPVDRRPRAAPGLRELPARQVALLDRERRLRRRRASARARSRRRTAQPLIPYVNSDFIYSALAQELGLVGVAALLLVFMLFVARGMKIALQADDGFSKLLAAGLTFGFALQTFIIVGGVLRIIPLTGITLPFVSYGGSSVVANFLLLAGLLLVSNRANAQ